MKKNLSLLFIISLFNILAWSSNFTIDAASGDNLKNISGKVINQNNEPLAFVNIYVEGSTHGVTSNIEGDFTLGIDKDVDCILVFQYVGFRKQKFEIKVGENPSPLKITLLIENIQLGEVVISASQEDPAYPIIRRAISKRKYYDDIVQSFSAKMYMKSNITLTDIPEKFLFVPKDEMPDSTDLGLVYLSESVSTYHFQKPGKQKEEMIASKVAGTKSGYSFNRADMIMLNFYKT